MQSIPVETAGIIDTLPDPIKERVSAVDLMVVIQHTLEHAQSVQ